MLCCYCVLVREYNSDSMAAAGDAEDEGEPDVFMALTDDMDYVGLQSIDRACLLIYPDQPNPLQATAVVKLW